MRKYKYKSDSSAYLKNFKLRNSNCLKKHWTTYSGLQCQYCNQLIVILSVWWCWGIWHILISFWNSSRQECIYFKEASLVVEQSEQSFHFVHAGKCYFECFESWLRLLSVAESKNIMFLSTEKSSSLSLCEIAVSSVPCVHTPRSICNFAYNMLYKGRLNEWFSENYVSM